MGSVAELARLPMPRSGPILRPAWLLGNFKSSTGLRVFRAVNSPPPKLSKRNMKLSAECVRAKTMSNRFFRVRKPSPLPTSTRISIRHKRAWSKMCSARRTAFKESKALPARARQPLSLSSAALLNHRAAGKTTTLTVIRGAAESQGYQVEGFAPTSRAARQLNEAGIEAGTLQGFLTRTANPDVPERKHLYLVDESSLA